MLQTSVICNFKSRFTGRIILPSDRAYESARRVHNGAILRHPALMAVCATIDEVCDAVEFARENQLLVAVRCGGHSPIGHSVCDGGIVIDLSGLKNLEIDPHRRVARAQAGVLAAELDHDAHAFGLATALGQCPSVGLGGLTTGGGFGWLTGKYGLSCDNLMSAQVVTADARRLTATADDNGDLFWAIRGGGGNYGVVAQFEYRLHPVSRVVGGMLSYPLSQCRAGFTFMREFLANAPDELTVSFGIRSVDGHSAFTVALCFCGNEDEAKQSLEPLQSFAKPTSGSIGPLSYPQMQSIMGEAPPGSCLYTRGGFLRELLPKAIDRILDSAARNFSAARSFWLDHYHGAMCRVPQGATAFSVREPGFGFLIQSEWSTPAEIRAQTAWVDETMEAMKPFAAGISYVANLGDEGPDGVRRCYGPNYPRLAALKRKYDPENLFRLNQNIPPGSGRAVIDDALAAGVDRQATSQTTAAPHRS